MFMGMGLGLFWESGFYNNGGNLGDVTTWGSGTSSVEGSREGNEDGYTS